MLNKAVVFLSVLSLSVFSANITIYDGIGGLLEDEEVEPGMATGQPWDVEAFFLDDKDVLSLVGGYDFKNGYRGTIGGDIFIAVDEVPDYGVVNIGSGNGPTVVNNTFGYDYAIQLVFNENGVSGTYNVYSLSSSSTVTVELQENEGSNPWKYNAGGIYLGSASFTYTTGLSDAAVGGLLGGEHNQISGIDLSFIGTNKEIWTHYTMECGNDNLMGHGVVVPEPGSLMMLGSGLLGLLGLSFFRRKR